MSNPIARRHYDREDRRARIVLVAKLIGVLILACVFASVPFMHWSVR